MEEMGKEGMIRVIERKEKGFEMEELESRDEMEGLVREMITSEKQHTYAGLEKEQQ